MKNEYIGVLPDRRTAKEKEKDWQAEEIASGDSMVPKFRKVNKGKWKKYTVRDQDGSGTCVAQTLAKGFEVIRKINKGDTLVFSATPIYQLRKNKPGEGMIGANALDIAVKTGTCLEKDCKSQKMSEKQVNEAVVPSNFEDLNDIVDVVSSVILPKDFDYVAAWIEKYGFAAIHIAADRKCWSRDFPKLGSVNRGIRHAVAGIDAVTYDKVQYIVIEDSWGEFGEFKGQRLISREVFKDMVTFAGGLPVFQFDVKPKSFAIFQVEMEYGQRHGDIVRLQQFLQSKGFFPSDVECTGYYGNITALAVYNFQIANAVASPVELNQLKGKRVGQKTLTSINAQL